jgi:hypothetical protein
MLMSALAPPSSAMPRDQAVGDALLGRALICFYRVLDWDSEPHPYAVRMHKEKVGRLPMGSYLHHFTEPGRRIVFVKADVNVSRSFVLRSGKIYYIRVDRRVDAALNRPKLRLVESAKGVRELTGLSYAGSELSDDTRQHCLRNDG